jgi:hypothetical protein
MPSAISGDLSAERRILRARKGVAVRLGRTEEAARLDAEIRTARLADYIKQTVDSAPPLTVEQRDRLAGLLRSGGDAA